MSIITPPRRLKYQKPSGTTLCRCRSEMYHCRMKRLAKQAFAVRPKTVHAVISPDERFRSRLSKKFASVIMGCPQATGIPPPRNRLASRHSADSFPISTVRLSSFDLRPSTSLPMSLWQFAQPQLRDLVAYEPGKPIEDVARELGLRPDQIIKLASNEN